MGQRLTVEVLDNDKRIALIYYHWSAYFVDTLFELKDLKETVQRAKADKKDILLAIIDNLEKNGGGLGIDPRTRAIAKEKYPDREFGMDPNRNDGLLFLDEQDIIDTLEWSEGMASIDISEEMIETGVFLEMDYSINELPVHPFEQMTFYDFDRLYEYVYNAEKRKRKNFYEKNAAP